MWEIRPMSCSMVSECFEGRIVSEVWGSLCWPVVVVSAPDIGLSRTIDFLAEGEGGA